jgi:regulator of protease activity HflC (stomatin/prohibitin superfamily)
VEEILRNREKIKSAVQEDLLKSLDKENIILESVNLTNFDFNPEFKKRIEAKQIEEKDKETAQVTLEKKTIEAQQKVEIAKADAEAEIAAAEGQKKSAVLKAEGEKEAKILE